MRAGELGPAIEHRRSRGYSFVAVLALLALCMLGLAVAGPIWSQQIKREREQELLRIGNLYAQAIASYYNAGPGSLKQYPQRLEQLLADTRFVGLRRHLRSLYPDPVNPGQPWGLVLDGQQRIVGVYSRSEQAPVAEGARELSSVSLPAAHQYADWKFIARAEKP
jgi:type II secretory pathway pseudopilin PulG